MLDSDRAHHRQDRAFGRAIGFVAPCSFKAGKARHADERSAGIGLTRALDHVLAGLTQGKEHTFLIYSVHASPDLQRHLAERWRAPADSGVRYDGVDPAHFLYRRAHCVNNFVLAGDVHFASADAPAVQLELFYSFCVLIVLSAPNDDVSARL